MRYSSEVSEIFCNFSFIEISEIFPVILRGSEINDIFSVILDVSELSEIFPSIFRC